jgi:hypothetical protein
MDPKLIQEALDALISGDDAKCAELLKSLVASAAGAEPSEAPSSDDAAPPNPEADAAAATVSQLCKLTGKASAGEVVALVTELLSAARKAKADQDLIDATSRVELVGELVKLGVEWPATAWQGDPKDKTPVARLASEPLADLRARVATLRALVPARIEATAPKGTVAMLSAADQAEADKIKDPAQKERFIQLRLSRAARRAS